MPKLPEDQGLCFRPVQWRFPGGASSRHGLEWWVDQHWQASFISICKHPKIRRGMPRRCYQRLGVFNNDTAMDLHSLWISQWNFCLKRHHMLPALRYLPTGSWEPWVRRVPDAQSWLGRRSFREALAKTRDSWVLDRGEDRASKCSKHRFCWAVLEYVHPIELPSPVSPPVASQRLFNERWPRSCLRSTTMDGITSSFQMIMMPLVTTWMRDPAGSLCFTSGIF